MNNKIELRPEVQAFAELMELSLRSNDHKGGWSDSSSLYLLSKLLKHVSLLSDSLDMDFKLPTVLEAVDVANYAMMIGDRQTSVIKVRQKIRENMNE
jgi:hypothetical protein